MAILVTGGAAHWECDCKVAVLDNLSRGHREALPASLPFYQGNVHFAAFANVGESMLHPRMYFENNVEQGIALLGSLLAEGVLRVVFSSSCTTYGEPHSLPINEAAQQTTRVRTDHGT